MTAVGSLQFRAAPRCRLLEDAQQAGIRPRDVRRREARVPASPGEDPDVPRDVAGLGVLLQLYCAFDGQAGI